MEIKKSNNLKTSREKSPWKSVSESASYMKISVRQMRTFIADGKIRFERIGDSKNSRILIHRKYLDSFILGYGKRLTHFQKTQLENLKSK
jgi:excisionase family DNA binding protein